MFFGVFTVPVAELNVKTGRKKGRDFVVVAGAASGWLTLRPNRPADHCDVHCLRMFRAKWADS